MRRYYETNSTRHAMPCHSTRHDTPDVGKHFIRSLYVYGAHLHNNKSLKCLSISYSRKFWPFYRVALPLQVLTSLRRRRRRRRNCTTVCRSECRTIMSNDSEENVNCCVLRCFALWIVSLLLCIILIIYVVVVVRCQRKSERKMNAIALYIGVNRNDDKLCYKLGKNGKYFQC